MVGYAGHLIAQKTSPNIPSVLKEMFRIYEVLLDALSSHREKRNLELLKEVTYGLDCDGPKEGPVTDISNLYLPLESVRGSQPRQPGWEEWWE